MGDARLARDAARLTGPFPGAAPGPAESAAAMPLVLIMGVSGAGKTTIGAMLAAALGVPFADADAFHPAANVAKMAAGVPLTDEDRWPWLAAIGAWLDARAAAGEGGVATCSALKRVYRHRVVADRPGVRLIHLTGAPTLIAERQAARHGHFMPPSLMASQFATLEPPGPEEAAISLSVAEPAPQVLRAALLALGMDGGRGAR
jgi:carbohydrate kinase (thermoresistant glucokinase family)